MRKVFFVALLLSLTVYAAATDYAQLRRNWQEQVSLGRTDYSSTDADIRNYLSSNEQLVRQYQTSMHREGNYLWDDQNLLTGNKSFTPAHVNASYTRLAEMARMWAYPGTSLYHDANLLNDIRYGLNLLSRVAYNERTKIIGNWWEWRIGIPWNYSLVVSILYDELTPAERDAFAKVCRTMVRDYLQKGTTPTYANLASACRNLLAIGVLSGNEKDIQDAMRLCIPAFYDKTTPLQREMGIAAHVRALRRQTSSGRSLTCYKQEGLYADGSFIQHYAIPYIGTYGIEVVQLASYFARVLSGSDIIIPNEIVSQLPIWISKAYLPAIYKGEMMIMFMGRGNAGGAYTNGRTCALNISEVSSLITDARERQNILNACADILSNTRYFASPYQGWDQMPLYKARVDAAISAAEKGAEDQSFSIVQAAGDRVIHQTPKFRFGLAMSSNRVGKYEGYDRATGKQNLTGWYTGDGMTYIYTPKDAEQYNIHYSTEANPYRVAGTTVDLIPREPEATTDLVFGHQVKAANVARAGGVMLGGKYSSAMMQLLGSKSDLMAKKSWFMFDNEVVCLGADIHLTDAREVITTVENRRYMRTLWVQGKMLSAPKNQKTESVSFAYLDGTGGYYFPEPITLYANVSDKQYTELWMSHGTAPKDASYAYVLLPQMTTGEVLAYVGKPEVEILANIPAMQAVRERNLDITAINYWKKGEIAGVESDGVAAVMMQHEGNLLHLSVSDPTWDRYSMAITLSGEYQLVEATPSEHLNISVKGGKTTLYMSARHMLGQTRYITLKQK